MTQKNAGKNVHVLIEPKPYKSEGEKSAAIHALQTADVTVTFSDPVFQLTHQKTFLLDHHAAMVMTFNLTKSTFKKERNFALTITDPATVQEIDQVFSAGMLHQSITVQNANLIWSPNNSREKILNFIHSAQSVIKIYAQSITDDQVINALRKAADEGVNIEVITNATKDPKIITLAETDGIHVYYNHRYIIHAKVIMIDNHAALIGSTNLTQPSIENNRELSVITHDSAVIRKLLETFERDKKS